jgi:hypothetical protein
LVEARRVENAIDVNQENWFRGRGRHLSP